MSRETYDRLWGESWGDQQRYGPVHRRQREALVKLIAKLNVRTMQKSIANFLYHLYALNIPRRGDVVTMLACPRGNER